MRAAKRIIACTRSATRSSHRACYHHRRCGENSLYADIVRLVRHAVRFLGVRRSRSRFLPAHDVRLISARSRPPPALGHRPFAASPPAHDLGPLTASARSRCPPDHDATPTQTPAMLLSKASRTMIHGQRTVSHAQLERATQVGGAGDAPPCCPSSQISSIIFVLAPRAQVLIRLVRETLTIRTPTTRALSPDDSVACAARASRGLWELVLRGGTSPAPPMSHAHPCIALVGL